MSQPKPEAVSHVVCTVTMVTMGDPASKDVHVDPSRIFLSKLDAPHILIAETSFGFLEFMSRSCRGDLEGGSLWSLLLLPRPTRAFRRESWQMAILYYV